MLDTDTKRRIDTARDILVGKVPDPKSQVEQITIALIYKFMDDMDAEAEELPNFAIWSKPSKPPKPMATRTTGCCSIFRSAGWPTWTPCARSGSTAKKTFSC